MTEHKPNTKKILIAGGNEITNAKLKALLDKTNKKDDVEFIDMADLPEDIEIADIEKSVPFLTPKEIEYQYQMIKDYNEFKYSHLTKKEREADIQPVRTEPKIGRNELCPCGSGKKYKNCCINKIKQNGKEE
jgi:uncharacterized protein YecA (UPF0149 family)